MLKFEKSDFEIIEFKPNMKAEQINEVCARFQVQKPRMLVASVKADGEFNYVSYLREEETFMVNRFGRKTTGLPALEQLKEALAKWNIVECELLAELHAVDNGKPLMLPNLIHYLKGHEKGLLNKIHIGVFDLVSINDMPSELLYPVKLAMVEEWFKDCSLVEALEYIEPKNSEELLQFWKDKVEGEKWEGLVIRENGEIIKVKPRREVDGVIIGINKRNKGFEQQKAKSLKMALLRDDGLFVEIGDVAGIGEQEAEKLWELTNFKVGEDRETLFVQPIVIATVEYIQTFDNTKNRVFRMESGIFKEVDSQTLVRLRNPHVIAYREDKEVRVEDIGLNQVM